MFQCPCVSSEKGGKYEGEGNYEGRGTECCEWSRSGRDRQAYEFLLYSRAEALHSSKYASGSNAERDWAKIGEASVAEQDYG